MDLECVSPLSESMIYSGIHTIGVLSHPQLSSIEIIKADIYRLESIATDSVSCYIIPFMPFIFNPRSKVTV